MGQSRRLDHCVKGGCGVMAMTRGASEVSLSSLARAVERGADNGDWF